jgi:hypothetical protein
MGTKLNKKGFSTVEVLLVVLIVLVLGLGGWYVYKNNNKSKTTKTSSSSSSTMSNMNMDSGQYAGWKTATLKYEKITFMYPSDWKINLNEIAGTSDCNPGSDSANITSPNGTSIAMYTGLCGKGDGETWTYESDTSSALGGGFNLNYMAYTDLSLSKPLTAKPSFVCLSKSSSIGLDNYFLNDKNITNGPGPAGSSYCWYPYDQNKFSSTDVAPTQTVDQIKASKDYSDAKLIFESMTY